MRRNLTIMVASLTIATLVAGCGPKREEAVVTVTYDLQPTRPLPAGMSYLSVEPVLASAIGEEAVDEQKWGDMTATMIQSKLDAANARNNLGLTIANRRDAKAVMAEADLEAAGLAEENPAGVEPGLTRVDGKIIGKVAIKVDLQKGKKRTVDYLSAFGGGGYHWGYGGGAVDTDEIETVARTVTVQPNFRLVDRTGRDWVTYAPARPVQISSAKKGGGFFGSSKTEADLTSRDVIVLMAVEEAVDEFLSRIIPMRLEYEVPIKSSKNENAIRGVKAARAAEYAEAMEYLQAAVAEDATDNESAFCAGVVAEALGHYDDAVRYYKMSLREKENDLVRACLGRVERMQERVAG
jgi:tetratricopeptide (TPR) repeat protein